MAKFVLKVGSRKTSVPASAITRAVAAAYKSPASEAGISNTPIVNITKRLPAKADFAKIASIKAASIKAASEKAASVKTAAKQTTAKKAAVKKKSAAKKSPKR